MAKIKAAFGSFMNSYACGPEDSTYEETTSSGGTATDHTKIVNVIKSRCKIHAIYWINTSNDETKVGLIDWRDSQTTDIAEIIVKPINYRTIVPKDASFGYSFNPFGDDEDPIVDWFDFDVSIDLYDTPSGFVETFPKPGLHFQDGVGVYYIPSSSSGYNGGPDPETHWVIFYSE